MESTLKQVIKEAILEALMEFSNGGIAVASEGEGDPLPEGEDTPTDGETSGATDKDPNKGNSAENSGGGLNNGKPKPNVGVGVFSRK